MHLFHIPVMGTGHTIDSPIRVAHFGIDSVISIVDDHLIERVRRNYCDRLGIPFKSVSRSSIDHRAERIRTYLDLVADIVELKFAALLRLPYGEDNDKAKYFRMLPEESPLRTVWDWLTVGNTKTPTRQEAEFLDSKLRPGSADVNIMAKVDHLDRDSEGKPLSAEFSDACAALRGFAQSKLESALVLSAGFNPRLYGYLSEFSDFYRDQLGRIKKRIVLKVSDFRSALIQGRFLAKKGLEVSEYRIESGLNCGGHAFATDGLLLPRVLRDFQEGRDKLHEETSAMVRRYYEEQGKVFVEKANDKRARVTVQGGVGNWGEMRRLIEDFGADAVGWGSPFLVVPEATCVDEATMRLLGDAEEKDLYLSNVSPLGVPFNNLRETGSEQWTHARAESGKPGSACPKGFLKTNTEFTDHPICTASTEYQRLKLAALAAERGAAVPEEAFEEVTEKACLCDHLGNGALIALGVLPESHGRQAVCPGPNMAWFKGPYTLEEMTDHIYGRTNLVPVERPHMFAKELGINVDYISRLWAKTDPEDAKAVQKLQKNAQELLSACDDCRQIASWPSYVYENQASLLAAADVQEQRLHEILSEMAVGVTA